MNAVLDETLSELPPGESALTYFQYDGFGKRRLVQVGDEGTHASWTWYRYGLGWDAIGTYAWDGTAAAGTFWNQGARTGSAVWLGMTPLAEAAGANPSTAAWGYPGSDHLGTARAAFDASKKLAARLDLEPYGAPLGSVGAVPEYHFTGKAYDAETGLYHFPYRYYNPWQARWTTRDPLGMVDGPNVYAYVRGGPVTQVDPLGFSQLPNDYNRGPSPCNETRKDSCKACCERIYNNSINANPQNEFKLKAVFVCCEALCSGTEYSNDGSMGKKAWTCCKGASGDQKKALGCLDPPPPPSTPPPPTPDEGDSPSIPLPERQCTG